jgi:hypothetical protein
MDEEEVAHKVQYLDVPEGEEPLETNWIVRAGRALVMYPDASTYEGEVPKPEGALQTAHQ